MTAYLQKGIVGIMIAVTIYALTMLAMPTYAEATAGNGDIPGVTITNGSMTVTGAGFSESTGSAWNTIISKYRNFIVGVSGIAAVTMVVVFIIQFLKLGASAGNPNARSAALVGVLWSGIAAAGLGAVSLIVGLFYRSIS